MPVRDLGLALLVMVVWGFNFTVSKIGVELMPPLFLIGVRFVLVALLVLIVPVPHGHLKKLFFLSLSLGIAHFGPMFTGLRMVDSGTAAIAGQLQVPFATLLAILFLGDKPGWRRLSGLVLAFAGVVVLASDLSQGGSLLGIALVVIAAFVWAIANLQMKGLTGLSPLAINGWVCLFAAPQLFIGSAILEQDQIPMMLAAGWRGVAVIAYLVLMATILAYTGWYHLVRRYEISMIMPLTLLVPVFGVLSGVVILGEALRWPMVIGGMLTLAGVAVILIRRPRQAPSPGSS